MSWRRLIALPFELLPGVGILMCWFAAAIGIHVLFWDGAIITTLLELLLWLALLPAAGCFVWTAARRRGWRSGLLACLVATLLPAAQWHGVGTWCGRCLRFQLVR
jgi:hypothetical protein